MSGMGLLLWTWLWTSIGFLAGAMWCGMKNSDKVAYLEEKVKLLEGE